MCVFVAGLVLSEEATRELMPFPPEPLSKDLFVYLCIYVLVFVYLYLCSCVFMYLYLCICICVFVAGLVVQEEASRKLIPSPESPLKGSLCFSASPEYYTTETLHLKC